MWGGYAASLGCGFLYKMNTVVSASQWGTDLRCKICRRIRVRVECTKPFKHPGNLRLANLCMRQGARFMEKEVEGHRDQTSAASRSLLALHQTCLPQSVL